MLSRQKKSPPIQRKSAVLWLRTRALCETGARSRQAFRNAAIFLAISAEFGSFYNYLCQFTQGRIFYETGKATSPLSDAISTDLQKRGMKFVGSTIIYAYLQAVGILYSHDAGCDLYRHS